MFKIHYTITIFIYINHLKFYSLHKTHERMINMGGTGKNIDIKQQLNTSTQFCSSLTENTDTISDFCFLINWLEAAAKKKKGKERQQHVAKLSNNSVTTWNEEKVPVLVGKKSHDVNLKDFVEIYCGKAKAKEPNLVMITRGAKRYSSLYAWVVSKSKSLLGILPPNLIQKSRSTASTFDQLANVISKSSKILGGIPKIEEDESIGQVKQKKISRKKLEKETSER